jgi:hypothetical protein
MKLEHLVENINKAKNRVSEADHTRSESDEFLGKRFDESDKKLDASMKNVLKEQSEQSVFAAAVHQTVLQVTQNNQLMLHNMINDLKHLERKLSEKTAKIKDDVGTAKSGLSSKTDDLSKKLTSIGSDITAAVKSIPLPTPTDLSGLSKEIKALDKTIKAIPKVIIPEQKDVGHYFTSLEKMIKGRTHTFEVEREPFGDKLIKTITAKSE